MRKIAAITGSRADWGILRPVVKKIQADSELSLTLIVTGAHLTPPSGYTVNEIRRDGFDVTETVDMMLSNDSAAATVKSMGVGMMGFADTYQRLQPDILLTLGDRFEMHAAAVAAVPMGIPIAHIHGGEVTTGAIDDCFRHAITKYSHLHFPSTQEHANRITQLGEAPWRVTVSGAPSLDNLHTIDYLDRSQLEKSLQIALARDPLLVTYHPVTLQLAETAEQMTAVTSALEDIDRPIIITAPNADPAHAEITGHLKAFATARANVRLVDNLGTQRYFSLMRIAAAMAGNSSSGIIEAASFDLPVVNIGIRQNGRPRSANIIDSDCTRQSIVASLHTALTPEFRTQSAAARNIYGDGRAGEIITERLKSTPLDQKLLVKEFHDLEHAAVSGSFAA